MLSVFLINIYNFKLNNFILLNNFTKNLLFLNKIQINYLILSLVILIFFALNFYQLAINIVFFYIKFFLKKKKIYFIKLFLKGTFKIHPIIFYIVIINIICMFNNDYKVQNFFKKFFLNLAIIALVLGSLWALYEIKWGYYWSNDSIEIILILVIILQLILIHKFFRNYKYKLYYQLIVINLLILLRSGQIYTKHNFFNIKNEITYWIKINTPIMTINYLNIKNLELNKNNFISKKIFNQIIFFCLFLIIYVNYLNFMLIKLFINLLTKIILISALVFINWHVILNKLYHISIIFLLIMLHLIYLRYLIKININIFNTNLNLKNKFNLYFNIKKLQLTISNFYFKNFNKKFSYNLNFIKNLINYIN